MCLGHLVLSVIVEHFSAVCSLSKLDLSFATYPLGSSNLPCVWGVSVCWPIVMPKTHTLALVNIVLAFMSPSTQEQ